MNSTQAQDTVSAAIRNLISVRDELGNKLAQSHSQPDITNTETRRLSEIHDRVSRTIDTYRKG